jgi:phage/plasmid-like protein (TIGR03299 family)
MKTMSATSFFGTLPDTLRDAAFPLKGTNVDQWAKQSGLDWSYYGAPIEMVLNHDRPGRATRVNIPDRAALYRSDNHQVMGLVSTRFKITQPRGMLELFQDIAHRYGFNLALAGQVAGGAKIWAMAETPFEFEARKGDKVKGALFFCSACDLTTANKAYLTSFRMGCSNQLPAIARIAELGARQTIFKVRHNAMLTPQAVRRDLDTMHKQWNEFGVTCKKLATVKVSEQQVLTYVNSVFHPVGAEPVKLRELEDMNPQNTLVKVMQIYREGVGQQSIAGTAWGAVNAVTRYLDHETSARSSEARIRKSWIQGGTLIKQRAMELALKF